MDVLSKKLDKGVVTQRFGLHPHCIAPMITHLSFADDILIFFDGGEDSLNGILSILDDFRIASGLGINLNKTTLFLDGGDIQGVQLLASRMGISHGALPVRYLGVPLTACKMKRQDYQPLLDRILGRFNGWTVKHLSFAGRLQLIQSVIYSTITFWASIFILSNQCLDEIERLCSAFLWKGAPNSARGAKVSWDSVCTPKQCGGLGLKRLSLWNQVLGLKLIWMIFAAGGSLWVSWVLLAVFGVTIGLVWALYWILQDEAEDDVYLWKIGDGSASNMFSTAKTWDFLHPPGPTVDCSGDETRQHLFFDCSYAAEVWHYFSDKAHVSPPTLFEDGVRWLKNPCRDKNTAWILRLAYQASMYYIWKERNSRLHSSSSKPSSALILEIKSILRCHLDPLSRAQKIVLPEPSLLVTWFGVFQ
ncbi:Reverse transcriptase domain [Arabidopsis suecica]|uniref:Reverse transcriptase domain n=1 Tax=Arabidopsis suecica TaxID=45249 RepID=A0A8T2ALV7_ARASU|nr:Reverse transcriptase domain [Arabidopsis suecica]